MNKKGGEELLILLAQLILVILASSSILYASSSITRGGDLKLLILESIEKAEDIKSTIDQERRYATESALFYSGASGGFLEPSECGIENLKEKLPFIPEDGAYYWKKQFEAATGVCSIDSECSSYGAGAYCYYGDCYKADCNEIPSHQEYLATVRNYLNTYFDKADPRVCNLLNIEDPSVPTQDCLSFKSDLVGFEWSDDVTIELNDWRDWDIEFNFFPDRPTLSIIRLAGGQVILDYDYSTLVNLRFSSDTLRMLRFAQDYVDGEYGDNGDLSWINNELDQFIKTRYGTHIVGLLVCDNQAVRNCYPYFDWITSFMSYFLIENDELPECSINSDEGGDVWRYFNGEGKESGIEVQLFNCFGDNSENVNPENGDYSTSGNAITCADYCYNFMIDYVKSELNTMLTDHTVYYSFPSKLKAKTGYNWRGYMFDMGVEIECKEILFRDPLTGRDCSSNICSEYDLITCSGFDACGDINEKATCEQINFDLSSNEYRYFTVETGLTVNANANNAYLSSVKQGEIDVAVTLDSGECTTNTNSCIGYLPDGDVSGSCSGIDNPEDCIATWESVSGEYCACEWYGDMYFDTGSLYCGENVFETTVDGKAGNQVRSTIRVTKSGEGC